ncbi:hypothetical protein ABT030_12780 [Streptomyces mirabilis]|uniref:hypothetical protein n=1 Tax=Streptomyces mirabilis TaxID=68239 RepID=UPI0033218EA3
MHHALHDKGDPHGFQRTRTTPRGSQQLVRPLAQCSRYAVVCTITHQQRRLVFVVGGKDVELVGVEVVEVPVQNAGPAGGSQLCNGFGIVSV